MSDQELGLHVNKTLEAVGARAIAAWHRMERHESVSVKHVDFIDWETMVRVLSPKRLELLRHLHKTPAVTVRALAQSLGRDYRRVHEDVTALSDAGLLERDKAGLHADYDTFDIRLRLAL